MKLTKDMFDFEKYDYFAGSTFSGKDPVDVFHAGAWVPPVDGACMYELARALKPKPRYILLNEGEKQQVGDQQYMERMMFALERIANDAARRRHLKKERDWDNE
jgi:hypothetical protein